jgi:hypothetical protein
MDQTWTDITAEQPAHGARVLVKFADGRVRIGDYNRFDFRLWAVSHWKSMPSEQQRDF